MMTTARGRVPGVPFVGIYQAFDGRSAQTGQGVPTPDQLRTQLEDFVRDGASGLVAFISQANSLPGWVNLKDLGDTIRGVHAEIRETGGMTVRPETDAMRAMRIQPVGHWQSPQPFHGVVPAWQVIGPFHDVDKKGLSATFPPDAAIDFAGVYPVKRGTTGWRVCETTCGVLGLTNLYGDHGALHDCVEYAVVDVTSPVAQQVKMLLGTDNDAIIALNGAEIYRYEGPRGLSYDTDTVEVALPAGTSRIVAKIYNRTGMWGIAMRFVDLEGKPLQGLTFSPESE